MLLINGVVRLVLRRAYENIAKPARIADPDVRMAQIVAGEIKKEDDEVDVHHHQFCGARICQVNEPGKREADQRARNQCCEKETNRMHPVQRNVRQNFGGVVYHVKLPQRRDAVLQIVRYIYSQIDSKCHDESVDGEREHAGLKQRLSSGSEECFQPGGKSREINIAADQQLRDHPAVDQPIEDKKT